MASYIEINAIAIIVGLLLFIEAKRMTSKNETSQMVLHWLFIILIIFSLSDISAYFFRGNNYLGVEISNIIYFVSMAVGCYTWFLFTCVKMNRTRNLRLLIICTGIPMMLLIASILTNPFTHFFFSVDEELLYHRGPGVIVTWIVEWAYVIAAFVINVRAVIKEKSSYKRQEHKGYLFFLIPLALGAVIQMIFYGTTTNQIGLMIALLMVYLNRQSRLIQKDALTGLNNKNALLSYRDYLESRSREVKLTIFMLDADNFKQINDQYGHLKGDQALRNIADILKSAAGEFTVRRMILYRYAGDEFLIVGTELADKNIQDINQLITAATARMNEANKALGIDYTISLSVGSATGSCSNSNDFDQIMKLADENMYAVKQEKKVGR